LLWEPQIEGGGGGEKPSSSKDGWTETKRKTAGYRKEKRTGKY